MNKARMLRMLVPAVVAAGVLIPSPARAIPRNETSCAATGTNSAGCFFRCVKGEKVIVTIENIDTTAVVTGSIRCGSQEAVVATSSGLAPPNNFDSGTAKMKKNYTPDDATDSTNCFSSVLNSGAKISIACAVVANDERARGAGAAAGEIQYQTPLSALTPTATAFRVAGTAPMTVADPGAGQAFAGTVAFIAQGVTNGGLLPETCAYGAGNIAVDIEGFGVGSLSGTGFGRYERVGEAMHVVVDVPDLAINGVASEDATFELDVALSSPEPCALGTRESSLFGGAAAFGT